MMKDEFTLKEDRPLIPNKEYDAQCINYDLNYCMGGKARKLYLYFRIIEPGEHLGVILFMACNMPLDGKIRHGHKFYQQWIIANGWRKPSKNAKMSPRIFKNKVFRIKTREANKEKHDAFKYSVVHEVLDVITRPSLP